MPSAGSPISPAFPTGRRRRPAPPPSPTTWRGSTARSACMFALRARDMTGRGQFIDIGLYEPIFRILDELAASYDYKGYVRERMGPGTVNVCPHSHYPTKDGKWIAIACTSRQDLRAPCGAHGRARARRRRQVGQDRRPRPRRRRSTPGSTRWTRSSPSRCIKECDKFEVPCGPVTRSPTSSRIRITRRARTSLVPIRASAAVACRTSCRGSPTPPGHRMARPGARRAHRVGAEGLDRPRRGRDRRAPAAPARSDARPTANRIMPALVPRCCARCCSRRVTTPAASRRRSASTPTRSSSTSRTRWPMPRRPRPAQVVLAALAKPRRCKGYVRVNALATPWALGDLMEMVSPRGRRHRPAQGRIGRRLAHRRLADRQPRARARPAARRHRPDADRRDRARLYPARRDPRRRRAGGATGRQPGPAGRLRRRRLQP